MRQLIFLFISAVAMCAQAQSIQINDRALPEVKRMISSRLVNLTCEITAGSTAETHRNRDVLNYMRNFIEQSYRAVVNEAEGYIVFSTPTGTNSLTVQLNSDSSAVESAELIGRHVLDGSTVARVFCE